MLNNDEELTGASRHKLYSSDAAGKLNKNLNDKDCYTIHDRRYKNPFGRLITMRIYINREQNSIC
jgi:hypothetical protein